MMDGYRLGIDFGTSNTVAVLAGPDGRVRSLLFDASPLLASAVFAGPGSDLLTGADAERAAATYPAGYEANPKRRIDDHTVWLGEREYPVVDLVAAVLSRVAAEARRVAGGPPTGVVLTHPAGWGHTRLAILAEAADRAGLARAKTPDARPGELGFVAEPVAAAAYFATVLGRDLPPGRSLLVYDLGAGTFDVAVVRRTPAGFEVAAAAGLPDVGGLDLDAAVIGHARQLTAGATDAWGRLDWPHTPADQHARHTLWRSARAAKEQLSRHTAADLHVPLASADLHLTRDEFDKAARSHLDRTVTLTLATLRQAGTPREDIAGVFLVGGSSRIPLVATLLHRALRFAPTAIDQPELVVAEGSLHTRPTPAVAPTTHTSPAGVPTSYSSRAAAPTTFTSPADPAVAAEPTADHPTPIIITTAVRQVPQPAIAIDQTANTIRPLPSPTPAPQPPAPAAARRVHPALSTRRVMALAAGALVVVLGIVGAAWFTGLNPGTGSVANDRPSSTAAISTAPTAIPGTACSSTPPSRPPTNVVLSGHAGRVYTAAFSADGRTLVTGSEDGTVRLWDVNTGQTIRILTGHSGLVGSVAFSPDCRTVASTGSDDTVRLWDVNTGQTILTLIGHTSSVFSVAFSPDGKTVASASQDETVRLWDVATGKTIRTFSGHAGFVMRLEFSPDGKTLATASDDKTARLWDVASGKTIRTLTGHTNSVWSVAFSPDGKTLATTSDDKTVRLWEVATGQTVRTFTGQTNAINGVAFSPDGKTLATASASDDTTVRLWDLTTGRTIRTLTGHSNSVNDMVFSPDGKTLATAGGDKTARLWNVAG